MIFRAPLVLLLLPLVGLIIFYDKLKGPGPSIRFSSGRLVKDLRGSSKLAIARNMVFFRAAAFSLIIIALARPQAALDYSTIDTEGIDIVLAVDVSTSMLAEDFNVGGIRENRLEVAKRVMSEFIAGRTSDRIGIVAFAGRAYTVSPLTLDYSWLLQNLDRVEIGMIEDGTAIGSGISSALNRLSGTEAKSKVIILLTDGINNAGRISPLVAAEAARTFDTKIYAIGAGSKGLAPYPAKDYFGNTVYQPVKIDIDEDTLRKIAEKTNALYFRATDTESLRAIYKQIDSLEKAPVEEEGYTRYNELFGIFLMPALALIFLYILLNSTVMRKIP
jgi:Ca-activated chloride channel family protein